VASEKFLGYLGMKSPTYIKEVQMLNGSLAALNRFLSQSTDKCKPFFQAIKNGANFHWKEYEAAFQSLKRYLSSISPSPIQARQRGETIPLPRSVRVGCDRCFGSGRERYPEADVLHQQVLDVETRY